MVITPFTSGSVLQGRGSLSFPGNQSPLKGRSIRADGSRIGPIGRADTSQKHTGPQGQINWIGVIFIPFSGMATHQSFGGGGGGIPNSWGINWGFFLEWEDHSGRKLKII